MLTIICVLSNVNLFGKQSNDDDKKNKNGFYPVPVLFYLPNTGYAFGAAFLYYNNPNHENSNRFPDILGGFATYSTKKQIQVGIKVNKYFGDNDYRFDLDAAFYRTPSEFWGIGPDPNQKVKEDVTYDQYRVKLDFLFSPFKDFYIGPFYWYEKFDLSSYDPDGIIVTGGLLGALGVTTSGFGLELVLEGRDSLFFPTKGHYTELKILSYNKSIGSKVEFYRLDLDSRNFLSIIPNYVLAFNTVLQSTAGDVPIQMLPKLGNQQIMRGYPTGKYLDKNLWAVQSEFRIPLFWRIGASTFLGIGQVFPKFELLSVKDLKIAGGLGLRYILDREQHLNVRLDVAHSEEGTFVYFTIQEAF